jgi:FAD/FMN-containing dehydrogenase
MVPALSRFRDRFKGQLIGPEDPEYDQARIVWNGMADRRPALIARCTEVDDVVEAIRFGREEDLVIAVRGGGHSIAGHSTCDGGIVIDLSRMREVVVDPVSKRARVQAGAHLSQLDQAAQEHGLVCPVGVVGHTGVAGLTLGGGMGRLMRKFGLTIDNLLRVDLITAEGEKVSASEAENPDLFWGLRGAGANFGVATSFEFRLHPMDGTIFHGGAVFPIGRRLEMAERVREFVATYDDVGLWLGFGTFDELQGQQVMIVGSTHTGSVENAIDKSRVFRDANPLMDFYGAKSYLTVQGLNDEPLAWGSRFYTKAGFFSELSDEVVDRCAAQIEKAPAGAEVSLWAHGGAVGKVADDAMAYTGRTAAFNVSCEALWTDPAHDEAMMGWGRGAHADMKPLMSTGQYVNEVVDAGTDLAQIYGKAKSERLVALKRKYDPDNVFRLNQNIRP